MGHCIVLLELTWREGSGRPRMPRGGGSRTASRVTIPGRCDRGSSTWPTTDPATTRPPTVTPHWRRSWTTSSSISRWSQRGPPKHIHQPTAGTSSWWRSTMWGTHWGPWSRGKLRVLMVSRDRCWETVRASWQGSSQRSLTGASLRLLFHPA